MQYYATAPYPKDGQAEQAAVEAAAAASQANKTSDLGDDELDGAEADDEQLRLANGQLQGNLQEARSARQTLMQHQQQLNSAPNLNFVDSDGMSSQGTQRSLNMTAGDSSTQVNSATNGSPSSGLGNELANTCNHCNLEGDTLPAICQLAQQQQNNGSSASSTFASNSSEALAVANGRHNCHQRHDFAAAAAHTFDLNFKPNDLAVHQEIEFLPVGIEHIDEFQHQMNPDSELHNPMIQCGTLKPTSGLRHAKKSVSVAKGGL